MMQEDAKYNRRTIQVPPDLDAVIQKMADEKKRSFSYICSVLLRQAINEKNRKRRGSKASIHIEDHAADVGSRDSK